MSRTFEAASNFAASASAKVSRQLFDAPKVNP
jgi:hypothetical protein